MQTGKKVPGNFSAQIFHELRTLSIKGILKGNLYSLVIKTKLLDGANSPLSR